MRSDFRKAWILGAALTGCMPRQQAVATAFWADSGESFLVVVVSFLPTFTFSWDSTEVSVMSSEKVPQCPAIP